MNEFNFDDQLEKLKQLGKQADSHVVETPDVVAGVLRTIAKRQRSETLVLPCAATGLAVLFLLISFQIYLLDWQMASSHWPNITRHVLFQDSE